MTVSLSNTLRKRAGFSQPVLEHFHRPRHGGELSGDPRMICTGIAGAVKSGAQVRFQLRMKGGVVADVGWQVYGCPSTIASASWLAERVHGRTVAEAGSLTALEISQALQLAPDRRSRAMIVEDAFRAALLAPPGECSNNGK